MTRVPIARRKARLNARRALLAAPLAAALLAVRSEAGISYPLPKLPDGMKRVEGPYHLLIHDLTDPEAAEVMARMEAMVKEYLNRTRDFSGRVQGKMPFILFRREVDYLAAGGMEGTAGVFNGQQLMAIAGKRLNAGTWHTIQHEGFHQFASAVIGGELPTWVNEGLAEYFGEGVYTGDGFVTGGIPAYRLVRIKEEIKEHRFKPIDTLMKLSHADWNRQMSTENYDQAWAMVQFLAHADDGKYQKAFSQFMIALSRHQPWLKAWNDAFGSAQGFETRWEAWWAARPDDATPDVYAQAATRMLAAYAARAASQKQAFATIDDLRAAIKDHSAKTAPGDALPAGLAADAVGLSGAVAKMGMALAFEYPPKGMATYPVAVTCTLGDGRVIRSTTPTRGPRVGAILTTIKTPKPVPKPANAAKKAD